MILHLDFETRSTVDLKKSGADVYARHSSTDMVCMGYAFGSEKVELLKRGDLLPRKVFDHILDGGHVMAHNAAFELLIWNYVCGPKYGWPELKVEQTFCTMAMAYAMSLPGSLDNAAAAVGLRHQKDQSGYRTMIQLSQPAAYDELGGPIWWDNAEKLEKLYAYCKQDVEVERELGSRLLPLSNFEKKIWNLDFKINQRGIQIDIRSAEKAIELVEIEKKRLDAEINAVTGGKVATCTAVGQITDFLTWSGVDVESVKKSDVIDLLARSDLPSACRSALLLRQEAAKSSTAKLKKIIEGTCDDGRIRGLFQYHGAGTGRWAGRRAQFHNLPRPVLKQDEIDEVFELLGRCV